MAGLGELEAMMATLLANGDECDASSESSCASSDASSLAGDGDEWDNLVASACAALRESKLATRARQEQIARNDCTLAEAAAELAAEEPADPRAAPSRPLPFRRRAPRNGDGERSFPLPPPASVTLGALRGEASARVTALLEAKVAACEALRGTARRLREAVGEGEEAEEVGASAETWASPPAAAAALQAAFDAHADGVAAAAREAEGVRLELGVAAAEADKVCRRLAAETAAASGPAEEAAATLEKPSEQARELLEAAARGVERAAAAEARLAELNGVRGPHAVQRERAERLAERARGAGAAVQALLETQRRLREAYDVAVQMSIPVACGRPDIFETALQDVVIYPPRELPDYMGTTVAPPNASLAATVAADTRAALERRLRNVALTAGRTAAGVLGSLPQPPSECSDTEADDSDDDADTATTATTTATDPFPRALTEPQETPSHSPPPIAPPRSGGSGYRPCRLAARSEARPEEPRGAAATAAAAAAAAAEEEEPSSSSLPASLLELLDDADVRRHAEAFERHGVCDAATLNQLTRHDLARVGLLPAEVQAVLSSRASSSGGGEARAASRAPEGAARGGRLGAESVAPSRPVPGQGPMFAGSHETATAAATAASAADPLSAAGRAGGSASPLQGRSRGGRLWRAPGRLASSDGDARKVDAPSYQRLLKEAETHGVAAATVAQLVSGTTDIEWIDVDPAASAALKKVLNEVRADLAPPPPTPVPPPAPVAPPQPSPAAAEAPAAAPTTKAFNIAKQPTDKGAGIADTDCVITRLQTGGPAERAGLQVGMKIVKIAGKAVTTSAELKQQLSTAGDAFVIETEEIAAASIPVFGDAKPAAAAFGTAEKKTKAFNIAKEPTDKGTGIKDTDCVITKLQAGGPAERAGLKVGMKIVKIAGNAVTTSAEIKQQLSTAGATFVIDVEETASTPAPALGFGTPAAAATPAFGDAKPAATPFGTTPAAAATAKVFNIAKQPTDKGAGIADTDCVIKKLQAGGPAERAGLKVGMKITKVCGQAVTTSQQVKQLLQASGPNFAIEAEEAAAAGSVPPFGATAATPAPAVPAFGAPAATPAQPANPFGAAPAAAGTPQFGATSAAPTLGGAGAAQTFNIVKQPTDKGAGIADTDCVIKKLQAGGPAERAGLKVGMKITKVCGQAVTTSQQVKQLLQASGPNFQIEAEAPPAGAAAAAPAGFGVLGAAPAAAPAAATPAPFGAPPPAAPAAAAGFGVQPGAQPAPFGAAPAAAPAFGAAPAAPVTGGTATFNIAKQPTDKGAGIADTDCVITRLQTGGPAERAGLQVGMKITKIGGQAVANSVQVKHMLQVSGAHFQIEAEVPAAGAAAAAPTGFGVPGQPAAAAANPFGGAPAAAAPFGAPPAAAGAPGAFGAPPQQAAANPFGGGGGAAAPAQQQPANPFGGGAPAAPVAFGAAPAAAPGPFGAAPAGAAAAPFGAQPAAAAPAFGAPAAANPFGAAPAAAAAAAAPAAGAFGA
eukprot:Rhum_TRINITY_DN14537_c0_g1::Rhum_TRINITY_DN14537_c0_g1_i3::g.95640::m.95640